MTAPLDVRPKIWVPKMKGIFDFGLLNDFGQIKFFTTNVHNEIYPDFTSNDIENLVYMTKNELSGFDLDKDYLVVVGSPTVTALCVGILTKELILGNAVDARGRHRYRTPKVRLLKYDKQENAYYKVHLPI